MTDIKVQHTNANGGAHTLPPSVKELAKGADPTVGVRMMITPAIATEWLETRGNNRKVTQSLVDRYAKDMREGRWVFNGQSIQFDEEGKLLNGQHRLWAVIEAGFTMDSVIQWNIPRSVQATIDAGHKWAVKDLLYMEGEKNTHILQAALRWIHRAESGNILWAVGITNTQGMEVLERHPDIRRSVDFIAGCGRGPLPPSIAAYLHYQVAELDREKADQFFVMLATGAGEGWKETHPIYRLRERLNSYAGKGRMHQTEALAIAIIAWNAFYKGKDVTYLRWISGGLKAQAFPTIEGLPGQKYVLARRAGNVRDTPTQKTRKRKVEGPDKSQPISTTTRREVGGGMATHRRA